MLFYVIISVLEPGKTLFNGPKLDQSAICLFNV